MKKFLSVLPVDEYKITSIEKSYMAPYHDRENYKFKMKLLRNFKLSKIVALKMHFSRDTDGLC